jgi:hypothetical protein
VILVIHDPVYFQDVLVAIGTGDDAELRIARAVKKAGYDVWDPEELIDLLQLGEAKGRTVMDKDSGAVVIRLRRLKPGDPDDVGHLAHECVHAATMLFDRIGFPLKAEFDEPIAYYVQFLVQSVLSRTGKVSGTKKTWRKK